MRKKQLNYLKLFRHYEIIIASVISIFTTIILTIYMLIPSFEKSQSILSQQKELKNKLSILQTKDKNLSSLDGSYYKDALAKLNIVLPQDKDFVSLFSTFDSLQIKTGVTILRADFQLGTVSTRSAQLIRDNTSNAYVVPVSFSVEGTFKQMNEFLSTIADLSGRILTVSSANWTFKTDDLIEASFNGKAYFYPLPPKIGGIDSPLPQLSDETKDIISRVSEKVEYAQTVETQDIEVGKRNIFE